MTRTREVLRRTPGSAPSLWMALPLVFIVFPTGRLETRLDRALGIGFWTSGGAR